MTPSQALRFAIRLFGSLRFSHGAVTAVPEGQKEASNYLYVFNELYPELIGDLNRILYLSDKDIEKVRSFWRDLSLQCVTTTG